VSFDATRDVRTHPSAEHETLVSLATQQVHDLLDRLSPDQRDVMLLRVVGDLTLEQTAATLGKPVGAVKSLQHRALERLRNILGEAVSL
jgi:RNA polymerase sigma-70 factor (ECF subfamily)